MKKIFATLAALFIATAAHAQSAGTVTANAFAIGKGPGVTGYGSVLCTAAQLPVGQAAAPICRTMSGDATFSAAGALTLATVNAGIGSFGSATQCAAFTVNGKGLITAASQALCTPAIGSVTGLGTGVAAALAANIGSAGAPVLFNGAGGTPSSMTGTNITGLNATQLTSGTVPFARLPPLTNLSGGRITVSTGVPVLASAVAGATTVYFTPYLSDFIAIYDGTTPGQTQFTELSQLLTDNTKSPAAAAANSNYDILVWNDAGTIRATRGPAWSSATSRGTGAGTAELIRVKGIMLNAQAVTNGPAAQRGTYVGTVRTNAAGTIDWSPGGAASGGTIGNLTIWNMYNRVQTGASVQDNGASYNYSAGVFRQARASANNQVNFIIGLQEDVVWVNYLGRGQFAAASGAGFGWGVGFDTTTGHSIAGFVATNMNASGNNVGGNSNGLWAPTPLGFHFIAAVEFSDGTNSSNFNNASNNTLFLSTRM